MDSHADKVRLLDSKPVSPSLFAHFVLRTANREPLKKCAPKASPGGVVWATA